MQSSFKKLHICGKMRYISDSDLTKFSIQLFNAMGASDDDSKIATDVLISAWK